MLPLQQQLQHFTGCAFCALATLCKLPSNALLTRNMHFYSTQLARPLQGLSWTPRYHDTVFADRRNGFQRGHASLRTWLRQVPPKMR